jgi:hypothetical protein
MKDSCWISGIHKKEIGHPYSGAGRTAGLSRPGGHSMEIQRFIIRPQSLVEFAPLGIELVWNK